MINPETSLEEIAALVSGALSEAGIDAVLSGGGAVTFYSKNEYMSTDLDFITSERKKRIVPIVEKLGFEVTEGKDFYHPHSKFFIEFPAGPLAFGSKYIDNTTAATLETEFGPVRIITPTQSVMDRLAWVAHVNDLQSKEQAVLVAKHQEIDWEEIFEWADTEQIDRALISEIQKKAGTK